MRLGTNDFRLFGRTAGGIDLPIKVDASGAIIVSGAGTYNDVTSFSNADLSSGVLTVTHNLGRQYILVQVFNNSNVQVLPDNITCTSANAVTIDLSSFGTIAGTWRAVVRA